MIWPFDKRRRLTPSNLPLRVDRKPVAIVASGMGDDTGGGLFAYDGTTVEEIDALSTGALAVTDGRVARVLRGSVRGGGGTELLVYDDHGVERYYRIDGVVDTHDVAWRDDGFVLVSTATNSIAWVSGGGDVTREWRAPGSGDAWHLNSLHEHDGRLYACAFGKFEHHRQWDDENIRDTGFVFDIETGQEVLRGLWCPHDPRFFDGGWAVCASAAYELQRIGAGGAVERRVQLNGWTRGLAVTDDFVFVGESANRVDKAAETASIAVLRRDDWSLVARLAVPSREIYTIAVVPPPLVEGLRSGFRTNAFRAREQDRHALLRELGERPAVLWATPPLQPHEARARIDAEIPAVVKAGELFEVPCTIQNLTSSILVSVPPHAVNVSYRWLDADGEPLPDQPEPMRARLSGPLPPGETTEAVALVRAPAEPGERRLRIVLVQELVRWFDEVGLESTYSAPVRVAAAVRAAAASGTRQ